MMRIYVCGAHSSGKTTLVRYISEKYKLPMITEVARKVLVESEIPLERLRTDLDLVDKYQEEIWNRQIIEERNALGSFVSDRGFDNIAYAAEHSNLCSKLVAGPKIDDYVREMKKGVIFFVRPDKGLLTEDNVRESPTWESVLRIDGMIKFLLEMYGMDYLPISTVSMQERARIVDFVINRLK